MSGSAVAGAALAQLALDACADAFAEPVVYTPSSGPQTPTRGIFEAASRDFETRNGETVEVVRPRLGVNLSDLPAGTCIAPGEAFVIRGLTYRVSGSTDDGMGSLRIDLDSTDR